MSAGATATRQRASALTGILAVCGGCVWASDANNALGNAARHHDATGHAVTVDVTRRITYGDPTATMPGQTALDDVGDAANAA